MISRLLTSEKKTIFFFYRLFSFSFLIKLKRKKKDILFEELKLSNFFRINNQSNLTTQLNVTLVKLLLILRYLIFSNNILYPVAQYLTLITKT